MTIVQNLGRIDGLDEYIEKRLAEKQKIIDEQQATISKQLDQIIELQDKYRILEFNHSRLEKRNKAQYEKIGEQQERINELENINEDLSKFIDYAGLSAEFYKWLFSIKEVRVGE